MANLAKIEDAAHVSTVVTGTARTEIEEIAKQERRSISQVARDLLDSALAARKATA